jgi:hypothetical protein
MAMIPLNPGYVRLDIGHDNLQTMFCLIERFKFDA